MATGGRTEPCGAGCGNGLQPEDNFCSRCGMDRSGSTPEGRPGFEPDGDPSNDAGQNSELGLKDYDPSAVLLDLGGRADLNQRGGAKPDGSATTQVQVSKQGAPRSVVVGASVLALLGLLGLIVFSARPGASPDEDPGNSSADQPGATTTTEVTSQLDDGQIATATSEVGHSSPHSVRKPKESRGVTITPSLPSDVDLGLLFVHDDARPSTYLRLEERQFEEVDVNGRYLAGSGSRVALNGSVGTGKALFVVDLATDPFTETKLIVRNEFSFDSVDVVNGQASFMDRTSWERVDYDIASGRELSRSPVPEGLSYQVALGGEVELRNGEDGGLFTRRPDDTFQKVLEGQVLVSDRDTLLVRTCQTECVDEWIDRQTFTKLDYPSKVDDELLRLDGMRWAISTSSVQDITTGAILDVVPSWASSAGVSPDGRWVAVFDSLQKDRVLIFDTENLVGPNPAAVDGGGFTEHEDSSAGGERENGEAEAEVEDREAAAESVYVIDLGESHWSDRIVVVDLASSANEWLSVCLRCSAFQ